MIGRLGHYGRLYYDVSPEASFNVSGTYTQSSTLTFTDTSTNYPDTWLWDFGDGATSSSQNPSHTYSGAGSIITVGLTASNEWGSSYVEMKFIDITQTELWISTGNSFETLKSLDSSGNDIVSIDLSQGNVSDVLINDNEDEVIIVGSFSGFIKSYDFEGTEQTRFATFSNNQNGQSNPYDVARCYNFDGNLWTNLGGYNGASGGENQVNVISFTGSLVDTYTFALDDVKDFWLYSNRIYAIGATTGGYTVDKVNVITGNPDTTFRSNVSKFNGVPSTIEANSDGVYVMGAYNSYGTYSAQRRIILNTDGTYKFGYGTANNGQIYHDHGLGRWVYNDSTRGYGIVSLNGSFTGDPLATGNEILDFNSSVFTFDGDGNNYWIGGNFTSYGATAVSKIAKVNNNGGLQSFTASITGGVGVIRYVGSNKK